MILLITLFACHWLADYSHLSTDKMLNAKRLGTPIYPILEHAAVHACLMGFTFLIFGYSIITAAKLIVLQFTSHFLIDLWKGRMNFWFPSLQNPANRHHWYIFGFDQFLHAVVIILMASITKS